MKATLVVVNPASGGGRTRRRWPAVEKELAGAGVDFQVAFTSGPGDATRIARKAVHEGRALVVAAGGDGTISETAAGFFADGEPIPGATTRLGILPTGTGGDFRRTFGIPIAAAAAARVLAAGHTRRIDAGMRMAPMADPGDGLLDVIVIGDVNALENARGLGRIRKGTHLDDHNPKFQLYRGHKVHVESEEPTRLDVDGEQPGFLPATFEVIPGALELVIPVSTSPG